MRGKFLAVIVADQTYAVPVALVCDLVKPQPITVVPHAPPAVTGIFNLRGRIVTAIDLRERLGLPLRAVGAPALNVVIDHGGERYALAADDVDDVMAADELAAKGWTTLDVIGMLPLSA
jgi:purine-binding chemotaxis protein CheW